MAKKIAKPTPVAPQRLKKATEPEPEKPKAMVKPVAKAAPAVKEPVKTVAPPLNKPTTAPINKPAGKVPAKEQPKEKSIIEKRREIADKKFELTPQQINDRGPSQITVSRSVRIRFRKACFVNGTTMSDEIERMMDRYAEDFGFPE